MEFDGYDYLEKTVEDHDDRDSSKKTKKDSSDRTYRKRDELDDDLDAAANDKCTKKHRADEENGSKKDRDDRDRERSSRDKDRHKRRSSDRDKDRERETLLRYEVVVSDRLSIPNMKMDVVGNAAGADAAQGPSGLVWMTECHDWMKNSAHRLAV
ncbi:hypothetical protein PIB30_014249 [Stylosanthes scabra]|uniref:Uncharacterized protein n=1 Tax=Stylosanthes scabra TaxID=79078 RepID=A0ABU6Y6U8_9FABA|nr:hypothetical protein [Stylosanthes scabra]